MSVIRVANFGGLIPRLSSRLLPDTAATAANNTKMYSGELRSWRTVKQVVNLGQSAASAHKIQYNGSDVWMFWDVDTDVVRAPVVNDSYERHYWTMDWPNSSDPNKPTNDVPQYNTAQRIYNGDTSYDLGVVAPGTVVGVTPPGSGVIDETRAYAYTFVTTYGEESAPFIGDVVAGFEATGSTEAPGTYWHITGFPTSPIGTNSPVASINLYRTVSGYETTTFFLVATGISPGATAYDDYTSNLEVSLNNQLESTSWQPPPTALRGLISHPNGFLAGFVESDVYLSVPYRPHAWPIENIIAVDDPVVGLGLVGNTIIVMTETFTYGMSGIRPESMTLVKTNTSNPCISKRSIVSFHTSVLYQSNDGIMITDGNVVNNKTLDLMTVTDWQELYGTAGEYSAARYGDRYLAFDDSKNGFLLDFRESQQGLVDLSEFRDVSDVFLEELSGDTMLIEGPRVLQWDPPDTIMRSYVWQSKEFEIPKPENFGALQVKFYIPPDLTGSDTSLLEEIQEYNRTLLGYVYSLVDNGSAADVYNYTAPASVEWLLDMQMFEFTATATNTGASTLTVLGDYAYDIVRAGTTDPLVAGDITDGSVYQVFWRGNPVRFELYAEDGVLLPGAKWNQHHLHPVNNQAVNAHAPLPLPRFIPYLGVNRGPLDGSGVIPTQAIEAVIPYLKVTVWARNTYYQRSHVVTLDINDQNVYRLPSGFKSDVWQIEVRSNLHVYSVAIAGTPYELRKV